MTNQAPSGIMKKNQTVFHAQKEPPMVSVSQISEQLEQILEIESRELAKATGFIKRERALTGADFAQSLIFGWLQEPHLTLCGLSQVAKLREVSITAAGMCQRFT